MANEIRLSEDKSPVRARVGIPKWVKLMMVADMVVLIAAVSIYVALHRTDDRENVVNAGLRGSKPPSGQRMPDLSGVAGISPALPSRAAARGTTTLLVATCMECPSGDIVGGAMRRLGARDLPDDTRVEIIGWQGDAAGWRAEWGIPESLPIHLVSGANSIGAVKTTLGIGDNGFAYLYDPTGTWRASYAVQLMQPDDIVHDMDELAG